MALATFRERAPSRQDLILLLAVCALPVHIWAILNLLRELPAWILRLSIAELVGVISYTLVFALFESLLFVLVLLPVVFVLAWFSPGKFVALGTVLALIATGWAIAAHLNASTIRLWGLRDFALWGLVSFVSLAVGCALVYRIEWLGRILHTIAERLTVLSLVYVSIDLLAVVVVVLRNI